MTNLSYIVFHFHLDCHRQWIRVYMRVANSQWNKMSKVTWKVKSQKATFHLLHRSNEKLNERELNEKKTPSSTNLILRNFQFCRHFLSNLRSWFYSSENIKKILWANWMQSHSYTISVIEDENPPLSKLRMKFKVEFFQVENCDFTVILSVNWIWPHFQNLFCVLYYARQ